MRRAFGLLWPFLSIQRAALAVALLAMLGEVATALAAPVPLRLIFDRIIRPIRGKVRLDTHLHQSDIQQLLGFALLVVAIALLDAFFSYLDLRQTARVAQRASTDLRRALFGHLQRLSLAFHQSRDTRVGDLQMRLSGDVQTLQDMVSGSLGNIVVNGLTALLMLVLLVFVDLRLALVTIPAGVVIYLLTRHYRVRSREVTRQARRQEGQVNAMLAETLSANKLVQAFGQEAREERRLQRETAAGLDFGLRASEFQARVQPLVTLTTALATAGVLLLGATLTMKRVITVGSLVLVLAYTRGIFNSMRQLAKLSAQTQKVAVAAERVSETFDRAPAISEPAHPKTLPPPPLGVTFDEVSFGYVEGRPVIQGLSLEVPAGATVALVGPTGAGKSSLASLVPRFYDVWEGRVMVGGVDVRDLSLTDLRSRVTMVLQEALLLRDTVYNNISYGREEATPEQVLAAAEAAGVSSFVDQLEDGFATLISERGTTLSGGQKQCVAIARALLRDAPIVIMDEPTSSLDSLTEKSVISGLKELMAGRTAIVIAHRFSTIQTADLVAVMDGGRLVEFGPPQRLLLNKGLYRAMSELQGVPG
jgi:ATP-binding cassette subfamily B protein/subfamily B ATP-binding cassette protein MsbA